MEGQGLPVELLRVVLHQLLGTQRQDGYRLIRDLERFALVGRSWRDAVFSTPLHLNLDYLPDPKREAVRWLLKATFAELQMHPSFHINRLLTNPDFAARNRWTLQRLWGAQLVGAPARWPQWRHFPNLHALELNCDTMADIEDKSQFFESRVLAPLTQLKHLSLQQFGGADLTRLPLSVVTLHADVDMVLPLVLPPELRLEELTLTTTRLLCDWAQLCKQVTRRAYIEASSIDLYVPQPGPDEGPPACLFRHAADGFKQGAVLEVELVSQEVCLVQLGGGGPLPKHIPEAAYQPDVLESMHLVTLAADFQQHEYRSFGCIYNPDDLQAEEYLGMTDGMTVQLHRHVPGKPQVLGFCYGLAEEQLSYLLSEAEVEGLALEAVEGPDLTRVLNNEEFQRRSGDTLQWLQGVDVLGELDLRAFPQLIRVEGYVLYEPESREAVGRLPPGLTSLDLCAVPEEDDIEGDPGPLTANWPDFVNVTDCPGYPCLAHLTQLRELSLRHFQQVDLLRGIPTSLQTITLECPRPVPLPSTMFFIMRPMPELVGCREPQEQRLPCSCRACMTARCAARHGTWRHAERFHFLLPPLEPGATRTLNIELHQNEDYELRQPMIYLSQFLNLATHVTITLSSDLVSDPADREEEESSGSEGEWEEEGEEWLSEEEEESDDDDSVEEEEEEEEAEGGEEAEDASGAASDPPSPQPALVEPAAAAVAPPAPPPQLGAVRCALVLAAGHGSLREAMEALTASSLQSIEVDAPRVLFIDESGTSCTSSHRMQALIRQHYGNSWLVCSHDAMPPDEAEDEEEYNGGFTMTRK